MTLPLTPALHALRKLHADLGGQAIANKLEAERLAEAIEHVEACIKLVDPTFNVRTIAAKRRNKPSPYFKKGKCFLHVLGVLRDATRAMTVFEIIDALLAEWGVASPTKRDRDTLYGGVNGSLRRHAGKTVEHDNGRPARWRIKE